MLTFICALLSICTFITIHVVNKEMHGVLERIKDPGEPGAYFKSWLGIVVGASSILFALAVYTTAFRVFLTEGFFYGLGW